MDINVSRLCKSYNGRPVLQDLTLTFPEGQVSCLMAPSGWGKTTLLRILLGLTSPDSGTITGLDGLRLGAVFQEDRLCPQLTAADNLRLVTPALTPAAARDALAAVGMADCAAAPADTLSGGQSRRAAILRALLWSWDALLLDEPFRGLDGDVRSLVIAEILRRRQNRTVLLVTHDPREAEAMGASQIIRRP